MDNRIDIVHDIEGRLRILVPALKGKENHKQIEELFSNIVGIKYVRIEPIISSMLVNYDTEIISRKTLIGYIKLFFKQNKSGMLDNIMTTDLLSMRKDLFRSIISGGLLAFAYIRKSTGNHPDIIDYAAVISTGYTVLSHGNDTADRLSHPDIITGIISMLSLGTGNILKVSFFTWLVNLFEIFYSSYTKQEVIKI